MFKQKFLYLALSCLLLTGLAACQSLSSDDQSISARRLSDTVRVLASDEFYGRAPGGPGEAVTVNYLIQRFQELGLQPAGEDGDWTQAVPLIHTQVESPAEMKLAVGSSEIVL